MIQVRQVLYNTEADILTDTASAAVDSSVVCVSRSLKQLAGESSV